MSAAAKAPGAEPASWDTKPAVTSYQPPLSAVPTHQVIPKTVDYGHGHGMSSKYEQQYAHQIFL